MPGGCCKATGLTNVCGDSVAVVVNWCQCQVTQADLYLILERLTF